MIFNVKGNHKPIMNSFIIKVHMKNYYWRDTIVMLGYIVVGFIIPWVFGTWLFIKHPKIILLIVPVGISAAFLINEPGFNYFWEIKPQYKNHSFAALPMNFGLYPILASFMIYFVEKGVKLWITLLGFTLFITGLEWMALIQKKVIYLNGWNIGWTFCIYLVALFIVYGYYVMLKKSIIKHLL
jgi:hypothetical protein